MYLDGLHAQVSIAVEDPAALVGAGGAVRDGEGIALADVATGGSVRAYHLPRCFFGVSQSKGWIGRSGESC